MCVQDDPPTPITAPDLTAPTDPVPELDIMMLPAAFAAAGLLAARSRKKAKATFKNRQDVTTESTQ
jgi:hypothetical protein